MQQHTERIILHDRMGFIPEMQGCFDICKSINVMYHMIKIKYKNYMIVSVDSEKAFDNI